MGTAASKKPYQGSIRSMWGLAKSPELGLSDAELHALVERETGKPSIRQLTQGEINTVCRVLQNMKDGIARGTRKKRTDEGGNTDTAALRRKIFALTGDLGWNDNDKRINGFCKKMFKVDRLEWLTVPQCHQLIEALKKMIKREEDACAAENKAKEAQEADCQRKEAPG